MSKQIKAYANSVRRNLGVNVLPVVKGNKKPFNKWTPFQSKIQSDSDFKNLSWWGDVAAFCVIHGEVGHLRCFDIDAIKIIDPGTGEEIGQTPVPEDVPHTILNHLGLTTEYKWYGRSGSGNGWRIFFVCHDDIPSEFNSNTNKCTGQPIDDLQFDHLELRWNKHYSVMYGRHPSGGEYQWQNGCPLDFLGKMDNLFLAERFSIATVTIDRVLEAFNSVATLKKTKIDDDSDTDVYKTFFEAHSQTRHTQNGLHPYVDGAIRSACENIKTEANGNRNNILNSEVHSTYGFVLQGYIGEQEYLGRILDACQQNGLLDGEERHKTRATIESAKTNAIIREVPEVKKMSTNNYATDEEPTANNRPTVQQGTIVDQLVKRFDGNLKYAVLTGAIYKYEKTHWQEVHSDNIYGQVADYLQELHEKALVERGKIDDDKHPKWLYWNAWLNQTKRSDSVIRSIVNQILRHTDVQVQELVPHLEYTSYANGVLHMPTFTFYSHDDCKHLHMTATEDHDYDPDLGEYLEEWEKLIDGAISREDEEFALRYAYLSSMPQVDHEVALFIEGARRTGKSTFALALMAAIVGEHQKGVEKSLEKLDNDKFALFGVENKTMLVATETVEESHLQNTQIFRRMISGENIDVERKYVQAKQVKSTLKLWVCTNNMPMVKSAHDGILGRNLILPWQRDEIPRSERNPKIKKVIMSTRGKSILLNRILNAGRRYLAEGEKLTPSENIANATGEWIGEVDREGRFLNECLNQGSELKVQSTELYTHYEKWCEDNGYVSKNITSVANEWKRLGLSKKLINGRSYWMGAEIRSGLEGTPLGEGMNATGDELVEALLPDAKPAEEGFSYEKFFYENSPEYLRKNSKKQKARRN